MFKAWYLLIDGGVQLFFAPVSHEEATTLPPTIHDSISLNQIAVHNNVVYGPSETILRERLQ